MKQTKISCVFISLDNAMWQLNSHQNTVNIQNPDRLDFKWSGFQMPGTGWHKIESEIRPRS
jgi:hypothetical protein